MAASPTWWEQLSETAQHLICLGLLLSVGIGFFAPALFSDKSIIGGDTVQWRASAESMLEYREETGDEPLWATHVFGGMPGYLISYPDKIPQLDLVPKALRPFLWPLSHFIFLLVGTYLLVYFLTRNKLSGVLAAAAFGLTTYLPVILLAGHNTKFIALCFAPWLVLAFAYALKRGTLLSGLLFAIAMAVNLRADHVQITYYVLFLIGVWWIVEAVGAMRHGRLRSFGATTGWLALGTFLALLMVAQPYLATYEYKQFSIRGASSGGAAGEGALDWTYAMKWSQGIGEMVTLLIADAFGGNRQYWGPKPLTGGPHYFGGIVILLAVLGLWRLRRNAVIGIGIGAILMMLFALGEYFELLNRPMFNYFPLFDAFRVPETWLSIVALAMAVLAGFGLYYLIQKQVADKGQRLKSVYIVSGAIIGLVAVLWLAPDVFFEFERPGEYEQFANQLASRNNVSPDDPRVAQAVNEFLVNAKQDRRDLFSADAFRTLFFLLLAAGLIIAHQKHKIPAWAMQATLVLLVVIDLGGVGRRYFNEEMLQPAQDAEQLLAAYEFDRFIIARQEEAGGPGHFRVLSLESGNPTINARPSYHYESLGGYHGAKLRLFQDYLDHLFLDPQTGLPSQNALDLMNTRYVVAGGALPGLRLAFEDEQTGLFVLENPDALPRALLIGDIEVVESAESMWSRIQSQAFDPRETVLLSEPIDFQPEPIDSMSTAEVMLERYGPREMSWTVKTDAPRVLLVSEVYYPAGWNAYINGTPAPIYRADYLLRAVPIPEGSHSVEMRFEPQGHRMGIWIAGISTLIVYGAVLVMLGLRWRRRPVSAPEGDAS